jgi:hypothetical protein
MPADVLSLLRPEPPFFGESATNDDILSLYTFNGQQLLRISAMLSTKNHVSKAKTQPKLFSAVSREKEIFQTP